MSEQYQLSHLSAHHCSHASSRESSKTTHPAGKNYQPQPVCIRGSYTATLSVPQQARGSAAVRAVHTHDGALSQPVIQTKTAVPLYFLIIIINLSPNWQGVLYKKYYQPNRKHTLIKGKNFSSNLIIFCLSIVLKTEDR